jgi:hypothetical protein
MTTRPEATADQKAAECLKFIETICADLPPSPTKAEARYSYLAGALCVALYLAMPELVGKLREAGARVEFGPEGVTFHGPTITRPTPSRGPRFTP